MQSILVVNGKGGCGKTTIATNLAACLAGRGYRTTLMDYDAQGGSERWHSLRPGILPKVHVIRAYRQGGGVTRSWQLAAPPETERVIIDAPAGVQGFDLRDLVQRATAVLVPVLPSPIDIHAAGEFVEELSRLPRVSEGRARVGVLANRVRENTLVYRDLETFLQGLGVPFLTRLRDSQNYVRVAGRGMGIHEMASKAFEGDRASWKPVLDWLAERARQPLALA